MRPDPELERMLSDLLYKRQANAESSGNGGSGPPPRVPPSRNDSGGSSDGVENRLVKLEAGMDYVKAEIIKLASVPVDMATVKERLNHLPTTAEQATAIDAAIERIGGRTQRIVGVGAAGIGAIVGIITLVTKLLSAT